MSTLPHRHLAALLLPPLLLLVAPPLHPQTPAPARDVVRAYPSLPSPESPALTELRHQAVAARRAQSIVIAHRGAPAFALENTLEACAAALDYGADGCEIDLRRTRDGQLILFHDDTLERLTDGLGPVRLASYRELQSLQPRVPLGRTPFFAPPTFAALLDLARERTMLLHLDLKEPGLEAEVSHLLDLADAWDHVVAVNETHAERLRQNPRLNLLQYRAPGLYPQREDLDPDALRLALRQPGQMILVDDPRVAALVLDRPIPQPTPFTRTFHLAAMTPLSTETNPPAAYLPLAHLRALNATYPNAPRATLLALLSPPEPSSRPQTNSLTSPPAIVQRAWVCQQLAQRRDASPRVIQALERLSTQPTAHPDWAYDHLDAALAIRALGQLGATRSASFLIRLFQQPPQIVLPTPASAAKPSPNWGAYRLRLETLQALAHLRSRPVRRFLTAYLQSPSDPNLPGEHDFRIAATTALLQQRLPWSAVADLLRSPHPAVRGTTLLACRDDFTEERHLALTRAASWALAVPPARFSAYRRPQTNAPTGPPASPMTSGR